jgi:hypothetical protein
MRRFTSSPVSGRNMDLQTIGNTEILLASVCKSPHRMWSDTDDSILAGDPNGNPPIWNSKISNPSSLKLLELFVSFNFEILTAQCSTHYTPAGRGDVLNIMVPQNVQLSEVIVTDIVDSDHLPIMFSILNPDTTR